MKVRYGGEEPKLKKCFYDKNNTLVKIVYTTVEKFNEQ